MAKGRVIRDGPGVNKKVILERTYTCEPVFRGRSNDLDRSDRIC